MKRKSLSLNYFLIVAVTLCSLSCGKTTSGGGAVSASVSVAWDVDTHPDGTRDYSVTGYRVYYGTSPRDYSVTVDAGPVVEINISNIPLTTVYFAVTAYNSAGMESDYSDEVSGDFSSGRLAAEGLIPASKSDRPNSSGRFTFAGLE